MPLGFHKYIKMKIEEIDEIVQRQSPGIHHRTIQFDLVKKNIKKWLENRNTNQSKNSNQYIGKDITSEIPLIGYDEMP